MIKAHPYEEVAYDVYELQNEGEKQGLGRIATLDNEITLEELANKIKDTLDNLSTKYSYNKWIVRNWIK